MYGQERLRLKTTLHPSQRNTIWRCRLPIAAASRPHTGQDAVSSWKGAGRGSTLISKRRLFFDIYLPSTRNRGYSDVELRHVQVLQAIRWFDTRVVKALEQRQDVADAGEVDVMLAGERLDGLQLHHVATRVAAAIGHGPLRLDHAQVLVHHQSPRGDLQDLGSHAPREDLVVEIDAIGLGGRGGGRDRYALLELHIFLGGPDYMV